MLVSLADMKTSLGIADTSQDVFLTEQLNIISDAVNGYCRRRFEQTTYDQTFYSDSYRPDSTMVLFQYPVISVTSALQDSVAIDSADYRIHKPSGMLIKETGWFYGTATVVRYTAGYAVIPAIIQNVVKNLVTERYNRKASGVNLSFGSDVQRVSIPGAISIDFDYTLNNNERKSHYGTLLGSNSNLLDAYRSERSILGSGTLEYVDVVP